MAGKSKLTRVSVHEDQAQDFEDQDRVKVTASQSRQGSGQLAWRITALAVAVDLAVVVGVWLWWLGRADEDFAHHRNYDAALGWVAAASAAVVFGFSEVPIKIPGSQESGPTLFNAYGFIGNGAVHLLLAFCLREPGQPWHLHWTGILAACDIAIVQAFARSAIWLLGIAIGPPLWCAVGMTTSFTWGTVVFGDRPRHRGFSVLGVAILVAGVGLVSGAGYLSRLHEEEHRLRRRCCKVTCSDPDAEVEARGPVAATGPSLPGGPDSCDVQRATRIGRAAAPDVEPALPSPSPSPSPSPGLDTADPPSAISSRSFWALALGLLYALAAGLADGSLVACYQRLEKRSKRASLSQLFCEYFGSFGLTVLLLGLATTAYVHLTQLLQPQGLAAPAVKAKLHSSSILAGSISGCMWAGANTCSVLASHFLGMALAFPVTQTCVAISGLVGMFAFGEIVGWRARSTFSTALLVVLGGAVLLSRFGQPGP